MKVGRRESQLPPYLVVVGTPSLGAGRADGLLQRFFAPELYIECRVLDSSKYHEAIL